METKELKNPYGAYRIKHYDAIGYMCGSLEREEDFVQLLVQVREQANVETFRINRFVDGEILKISVVDNGPKFDSAGFSHEDN